jgi:hypothetical protein
MISTLIIGGPARHHTNRSCVAGINSIQLRRDRHGRAEVHRIALTSPCREHLG